MNNVKNEYIFYWLIENYSYCWHENEEELSSPTFIIDNLEGTAWQLDLYPRGLDEEARGYVSLYLYRTEEDDGPEHISINFELSFLAADGSAFCRITKREFKIDDGYGFHNFFEIEEFFLKKKNYIPQDVLTIRCKIWKGEGNVQHIGQSSARTHIGVEKNSFLHVVENFSTLQPDLKQITKIQSHSKKQCFISSSLYYTGDICCEGKIIIEIVPSDSNKILRKCRLYLLDGSGNEIECGGIDNRHNAETKSIQAIPLSLSRESILNRKSEYLPDDKLLLICKCTFSSGIKFKATEETINEISSALIKQKSNIVASSIKNDCTVLEMASTYPSALDDLKALYIDKCLTDVLLKTETKSFPAHKNILSARSPVFKAMMTSDMEEENTDCFFVDDLENDIVQKLLLFLYSDKVEDLQWNTATRLYYAAEKYQIGKLKKVCATFLVQNLTTANAVELLLLADTHHDDELMNSVKDFILMHDQQIFTSKQWDMITKLDPLLAGQTMHMKYKRKVK